MIDDNFTIKPYHWGLTISIAIALHAVLLINYKQESAHTHEEADDIQNEIIIGLKKLKPPPSIKEPKVINTVKSVPVTPATKLKPIKKKQKVVKPKPITKTTPKISKPVITSPQVAPIVKPQKQHNTTSRQHQIDSRYDNTPDPSISIETKRTSYHAKLTLWLERHKKYPSIARRRNQQGSVTIQFVMNREGVLLRYEILNPSEFDSLNNATIKMLERASPMPIPPKELIGDKFELKYTIPVNFNLIK